MDPRPEAAEAAGTFLMLLAGGCAILADQPLPVVAVAFGGAVMVLVHTLGPRSGAHFNPAITLAFAATGHFPWRRVPGYVAAQVAGALAACLLLAGVAPLGPLVAAGTLAGGAAFTAEALATAFLSFTITAVATGARAAPGTAGVAIGAAVALGAIAAGPLTGAAMNPARALAPALLAPDAAGLAVHVAGPFVGALLGMGAYEALRRGRSPQGRRLASNSGDGEGKA